MIISFGLLLGCSSLETTDVIGESTNPNTLDSEEANLKSLENTSQDTQQVSLGLGWLYLQKQEYPKAISMFNQSLKINHDNPRAYMGLGAVYQQMGNYEYSIQSYQEVLKLRPSWYYAHYELGKIHYSLGNKQAYFSSLDTLVAKHPDLATQLMETVYHKEKTS